MNQIFNAWQRSAQSLRPYSISSYFKSTGRLFFKATKLFMVNFGWIILVDAAFILVTGDIVGRALARAQSSPKDVSGALVLIMFIHAIIWFIASSAFFLLMRKEEKTEPKQYFRIYFFRHVQALLGLSLITFMGLYVMVLSGITKFPTTPWHLIVFAKIFEAYIVLYWLDSSFKLIDFMRSCERAVNFIFYNMPFIIVAFSLFVLTDFGISSLISYLLKTPFSHVLMFNQELLSSQTQQTLATTSLKLVCRYFTFFIENLWFAFLFALYRRKKHEQYTQSIFELPHHEH